MHKEKVDKVPNSVPGRHNIEIEIYGMEGIPDEDLKEHERQKSNKCKLWSHILMLVSCCTEMLCLNSL